MKDDSYTSPKMMYFSHYEQINIYMSNGLNQNINNQQLQRSQLEKLENGQYNDPIRHIQARFLNFANSTKWLFYIPIGYLFRKTTICGQNLQVPINCQDVIFPSFRIGTTSLSYLGYTMDFSTRQNLTEKGVTIKYLINQNWFQYMMLLKWFEEQDFSYYTPESNNGLDADKTYNKHGNPSNTQKVVVTSYGARTQYDLGLDTYGSTQGPMVNCNLYLMDNFNNKVCKILFQNCWLTEVSTIPLSYRKTSGTQIQGSFQLKFSKYSLKFYSEQLKKMFRQDGISKQTF